jgi:hypothetical protein
LNSSSRIIATPNPMSAKAPDPLRICRNPINQAHTTDRLWFAKDIIPSASLSSVFFESVWAFV